MEFLTSLLRDNPIMGKGGGRERENGGTLMANQSVISLLDSSLLLEDLELLLLSSFSKATFLMTE